MSGSNSPPRRTGSRDEGWASGSDNLSAARDFGAVTDGGQKGLLNTTKGGTPMRGDPRTLSIRSVVVLPSRRWSTWIMRSTRRPRRSREERLELIERLSHEKRRRLRSGEYVPDLRLEHRWRRGNDARHRSSNIAELQALKPPP